MGPYFCVLAGLPLLVSSLIFSSLALAKGQVKIVVSVDWEGRDLRSENLEAMKAFQSDYADVPLQHFLNAAYYTKPSAEPEDVTRKIRSVLKDSDEQGLHIHAWRSLVAAAQVRFRKGPSFVAGPVDLDRCDPDCGNDVALTAYDLDELKTLIRFSKGTLVAQGFDEAKSFRAGGWQADTKVLRALAEEGITLDSSATDANYLFKSWGRFNLYGMVQKLWPEIKPTSQPYTVDLGDTLEITELPNNGCLADYTSSSDILKAFQVNAVQLTEHPEQDVFVSIGFHQETAAKYLSSLREGLDKIRTYAKKNGISYTFVVGAPSL